MCRPGTTLPHFMPLLQVQNVSKSYPPAAGPLQVLTGVSLDVKAGEVVAVVGDSGSGKSTLLHLIGALDRPTSGSIRIDGDDIFRNCDEAPARLRRERIGLICPVEHPLLD